LLSNNKTNEYFLTILTALLLLLVLYIIYKDNRMLEKLLIKNYLIIKEAELEFTSGLNILTGETGAGKSIILDAMSLILGERADYSIIRKDKEKMVVEGYFNFKSNKRVIKFLREKELHAEGNDGYVIIRRELQKRGISRNFINDIPVLINDFKTLGDLIVDIHSQNEHQSLLKKETHIEIIDEFINKEESLSKYSEKFTALKGLTSRYNELLSKKDELIQKKGFLEFQLKEINNVNPEDKEDEVLENELSKLENSEEISLSLNKSLELLHNGENNIIAGLSLVIKELKKISKYDNELIKLIEEADAAYINIKDVTETLTEYYANLNFEQGKIEKVRDRLGALNYLKKKYNLKLPGILEKVKIMSEELLFADNYDNEIEKLEKEIETEKMSTYKAALLLSEERKKGIRQINISVNEILKETGLENAVFTTHQTFTRAEKGEMLSIKNKQEFILLTNKGIDDIEFMIKTNKGDNFSPLKKTASGGEISRVMLSIKAALSGRGNIPILVFDEIDAGISGRIAGKVAKVIKELSHSHQIISITHLPQIAAMSDNHLHINKLTKGEETYTEIANLDEEEKINEVAKLLSGENISKAAIQSARELILEGKKF